MLEGTATRVSRPWRIGAFVAPAVPPHSSISGCLTRLKSRRSSRGICGLSLDSDPLHAAALPRSSSGQRDQASSQRCRRRARWPAARVGAGTSRNRGSLSSAAPQTLADPVVQVRCGAEETPNGRDVGYRGGAFAAGGIGVELGNSGGGGDSSAGSSSSSGDVRLVVGGEESNVSVSAARDDLPYIGAGDEEPGGGFLDEGEGVEGEVELDSGIDEHR